MKFRLFSALCGAALLFGATSHAHAWHFVKNHVKIVSYSAFSDNGWAEIFVGDAKTFFYDGHVQSSAAQYAGSGLYYDDNTFTLTFEVKFYIDAVADPGDNPLIPPSTAGGVATYTEDWQSNEDGEGAACVHVHYGGASCTFNASGDGTGLAGSLHFNRTAAGDVNYSSLGATNTVNLGFVANTDAGESGTHMAYLDCGGPIGETTCNATSDAYSWAATDSSLYLYGSLQLTSVNSQSIN